MECIVRFLRELSKGTDSVCFISSFLVAERGYKRSAEVKPSRSHMARGSEGVNCGTGARSVERWSIVIVVDVGSVPEAVKALGTNRCILVIVTLVVIIIVVPIPTSVKPISDIIFKFLGKKRKEREWILVHILPLEHILCLAFL